MSPIAEHREVTYDLARSLKPTDIYYWLLDHGYFPEQYVLPPCFRVIKRPRNRKQFFNVTKAGKYKVRRTECVHVHFPKSELTDRTFGIIDPELHNDIAYHVSRNWLKLVDTMIPRDSLVTSYSFPIPIDKRRQGRLGHLRSGRLIYQFIEMTDDDLATVAYKFGYLVRADIKNFYPSIYTHSLAWAIHGKKFIRRPANLHNFRHLGNRLDRLFQYANDGCTNGIPIGPVVSDIAAEIIAAQVDREFTSLIKRAGIECEAVRFKDDYQILVKNEYDARLVIKSLQSALKSYNLELSDDKTNISRLPEGLFRSWVSRYHAALPRKLRKYSWRQFREVYLAVISIDRDHPGTGVIDRFLADIVTKKGVLKVQVGSHNLEKVISMLLMLGTLRIKAFPKIIAIVEAMLSSPLGANHEARILSYLESYMLRLAADEERNKYLLSWISYFLVSNGFDSSLSQRPKFSDPIVRSVFNNRGGIFKNQKEFKVFEGCKAVRRKVSMIEHLDVFDPPQL